MFASLVRSKVGRALALCLVCLLPVAQALELGSLSMVQMPGRPMPSITFSRSPAGFTAYALKVGGVAFTSTAASSDGSKVLGFVYDGAAPDGTRLRARVKTADGTAMTLPLAAPDWIHVPLARLVATDDTGAVTLFGELEDKALEEKLKEEQNAMIASYHPAMKDTLLGLRLLQADMLVIEDNATDLFKDKGKYILGKGETAPSQQDLKRNQAALKAVQKWIEAQPDQFSSYITGDMGSKVTYAVVDGKLKLSGTPNWYCWRFDDKKLDALYMQNARALSSDAFVVFSVERLGDRAKAALKERARTLSEADMQDAGKRSVVLRSTMDGVLKSTSGEILAHVKASGDSSLIDRAALAKAHAAGDTQEMARLLRDARDFVSAMPENGARVKKINGESADLGRKYREAREHTPVVQMPKYSQSLSAQIRKASGINRPVFEALQTSTRLAAVMRAAKENDPAGYRQYVASLARVPVTVAHPPGYVLRTPTVYPRTPASEKSPSTERAGAR
jgi:hypothetical protein